MQGSVRGWWLAVTPVGLTPTGFVKLFLGDSSHSPFLIRSQRTGLDDVTAVKSGRALRVDHQRTLDAEKQPETIWNFQPRLTDSPSGFRRTFFNTCPFRPGTVSCSKSAARAWVLQARPSAYRPPQEVSVNCYIYFPAHLINGFSPLMLFGCIRFVEGSRA